MMSSVQNNWGLGSLGRQDTNKTLAAVWDFQANQTGYTNYVPQSSEIPQLNLTTIFAGVCNTQIWTPVLAPNTSAIGAGGGSVFYNASATTQSLASYNPQNLTAMGMTNPISVNPNYTYVGFNIDNTTSPAAISASSVISVAATATTSKAATTGTGVAAASGAQKQVGTAGGLLVAVAVGVGMLL